MTTTLTRSPGHSPTDQRQHPTAPPRTSPARGRRNHGRVAIGALLLAMCVLGSVALYGRASDRIEVLVLARPVEAGQVIAAADLTVASVSVDSNLPAIAATQRATIVGQFAVVPLAAGSLLAPSQVSDGPRIPVGMALTGATLKPGQYPTDLRAGDTVLLVETPAATAIADSAQPVARGEATVMAVEAINDASASIAVSLLVPETEASLVANAGAASRLSLVVVSAR